MTYLEPIYLGAIAQAKAANQMFFRAEEHRDYQTMSLNAASCLEAHELARAIEAGQPLLFLPEGESF